MSAQKKVCLIFAGGSLLSIKGNKSIFFVEEDKDIKKWLAEVPEASLLAELTPFFVQGEEGGFDNETIDMIQKILQENKDEYDGFVVLVRGEHMIYAAVVCEFMLQGFGKPIIFTGSRYSPEAIAYQDMKKIVKMSGLGLRSNLINAIQIAVSDDFPATAIMFGNKIIKPTHAVLNDFSAMNLYRSINDDYLGKIDFGITLHRKKVIAREQKFTTRVSRDVMVVRGGYLEHVRTMTASQSKKKGSTLLIRVAENQKIPTKILDALKKQFSTIILFNEHYVLEHSGVIQLSHMTWHTVQMKVRWAQGTAKDQKEFVTLLTQDIIGEYITQ